MEKQNYDQNVVHCRFNMLKRRIVRALELVTNVSSVQTAFGVLHRYVVIFYKTNIHFIHA